MITRERFKESNLFPKMPVSQAVTGLCVPLGLQQLLQLSPAHPSPSLVGPGARQALFPLQVIVPAMLSTECSFLSLSTCLVLAHLHLSP